MTSLKLVCPDCGKHEGILLVWGYPLGDLIEKFAGQQVMVGFEPPEGVPAEHLPDTECIDCSHRWRSRAWPRIDLPARR